MLQSRASGLACGVDAGSLGGTQEEDLTFFQGLVPEHMRETMENLFSPQLNMENRVRETEMVACFWSRKRKCMETRPSY